VAVLPDGLRVESNADPREAVPHLLIGRPKVPKSQIVNLSYETQSLVTGSLTVMNTPELMRSPADKYRRARKKNHMHCPEKTRLLMLQCESMVLFNRALASEVHLPMSRRCRTNAAIEDREYIKSLIDSHVKAHGCGCRRTPVHPYPARTRTLYEVAS
jgi:hypothetical protein